MFRSQNSTAPPRQRSTKAVLKCVVATATIGIALAGCSNADQTSASGSTGEPGASGAAAAKTCATSTSNSNAKIAEAQKLVNTAADPTTKWDGPTTGSPAPKSKTVVFIAANSNNQGDIGVYEGVKQAAAALGWKVMFIDGQNSTSTNLDALNQAITLRPDAIAVSSFEPRSAAPLFARAKEAGIPVVGNHTGESGGAQPAYPDIFANVTSDPALISQVAAACAIVASDGTAGATLTNCGEQFVLCGTKGDPIKKMIKDCSGCTLLNVNDYPFEEIQQREAGVAVADYQRFGGKLGYMLAINDLYWDAAIPALKAAGVPPSGPPVMIAAGDGSPAAFDRIRKGEYQIATVAEPLVEHGWQVADEIVRALNKDKPSGFVTLPHLVTKQNVDQEGGDKGAFDPNNKYRDEYKKLWGV